MIERYQIDLRDMYRTYSMTASPTRRAKLEAFFAGQLQLLNAVHFDALSQDGRLDFTTFS